jgi:DNA-binding NtrC family response regulator
MVFLISESHTFKQKMSAGKILIVDDNKSVLTALEIMLSVEFELVHCISNPNLILSELRNNDYNLVLLDMNFAAGVNTGNEGIYWLERICEVNPDISVVLMTAYGDVELAVKALKYGAVDFVLKPWENAKMHATVRSAIHLNMSRKEVKQLKNKAVRLTNELNRDQRYLIGSSPQLMMVLTMVRKVANTNTNVLITGENGTGKELVAREIHRMSDRSHEVLVSVDIGAISETLFESELFGHVKGAFTDARENRPGKFETADKGTLFLDEIGNLSFHLQAKILAAIQNREIVRVGSNKPIPVDIRLICATNKNLQQMVTDGLFREDLLYRINTIQIEVPPLRERNDDIIALADFFLQKFAHRYDKPGLRINQQARDKLLKYPWPGNVRELQHTIEKAVILSEGNVLKPDDFFFRSTLLAGKDENDLKLEEMEKRLIVTALSKSENNMSAASELLGITRQTLYNKIKKYGL